MKKKILLTILTILFIPTGVGAQQSTADLLAQIQSLVAVVEQLQAQLDQVQATQTSTHTTVQSSQCTNLQGKFYIGMKGTEVTKLQTFLADQGLYTHPIVTGYYGPATQRAVERFQTKTGLITYGSPDTTGYGLAGPSTRAKVREMSCAVAYTAPPAAIDTYSWNTYIYEVIDLAIKHPDNWGQYIPVTEEDRNLLSLYEDYLLIYDKDYSFDLDLTGPANAIFIEPDSSCLNSDNLEWRIDNYGTNTELYYFTEVCAGGYEMQAVAVDDNGKRVVEAIVLSANFSDFNKYVNKNSNISFLYPSEWGKYKEKSDDKCWSSENVMLQGCDKTYITFENKLAENNGTAYSKKGVFVTIQNQMSLDNPAPAGKAFWNPVYVYQEDYINATEVCANEVKCMELNINGYDVAKIQRPAYSSEAFSHGDMQAYYVFTNDLEYPIVVFGADLEEDIFNTVSTFRISN